MREPLSRCVSPFLISLYYSMRLMWAHVGRIGWELLRHLMKWERVFWGMTYSVV